MNRQTGATWPHSIGPSNRDFISTTSAIAAQEKHPKTGALAKTLHITRIFPAPRTLVFEVWTDPRHFKSWGAPEGFTLRRAKADLRTAGKWESVFRDVAGTEYKVGGIYCEVIVDALVVFTHAWKNEQGKAEHETLVTLRLSDHDRKTKVTLEHGAFATLDTRDEHEVCWRQCLDRLGKYLKKLQAPVKSARRNT